MKVNISGWLSALLARYRKKITDFHAIPSILFQRFIVRSLIFAPRPNDNAPSTGKFIVSPVGDVVVVSSTLKFI
jgi:hypothetical protein